MLLEDVPPVTVESFTSLLRCKAHFNDSGLDRFKKFLNKTLTVDNVVNKAQIEIALIAFLLSIKADEAQGKPRRAVFIL